MRANERERTSALGERAVREGVGAGCSHYLEDNISKIKERVDIVDLISGYLKLQKSGINYKANCPFHGEKTPSFYVSPERQIWHCFGCGLGGSIFDFVMQMDGLAFGEALQFLAKRAGIELAKFDRAISGEKNRLLELTEWAAKFFQKQLWESQLGQQALKYLTGRGMSEQSIRDWQLGFAPDSWSALGDFLLKQGYRDAEIFSAGLSIKREGGSGYYDRFRSRITFPVNDLNGQPVGFSGRIFERPAVELPGPEVATPDIASLRPATQRVAVPAVPEGKNNFGSGKLGTGAAKYINTPQTLIYDKSHILYGFDKAKSFVRTADRCLVMEGNVDVIMSHQAGAGQAVASSGTALTDAHLKIIKRYTNNLDFCFDQDSAGVTATERAINLAIRQGMNVGVVAIDDPAAKDPADYVQKYGAVWAEKAVQTKPVVAFYIDSTSQKHDPTSAIGKKLIADRVLPIIKNIGNKIEQSHWLGELAVRLQTREEILRDQLVLTALAGGGPMPTEAAAAPLAELGLNTLEDYLVSLLLLRPQLAEVVEVAPGPESALYSPALLEYIMVFKQYLLLTERPAAEVELVFDKQGQVPEGTSGGSQQKGNVGTGTLDFILKHLGERPGFDPMYLEKLYIQAQEAWRDFTPEHLEQEFRLVLSHLKRKQVATKLAGLEMAIRQAEKTKDKEIIDGLLNQFQTIAKLLNSK